MIIYRYQHAIFSKVEAENGENLFEIVRNLDWKKEMIENLFEVFFEKILKVKKPGSIQFLMMYLCSN